MVLSSNKAFDHAVLFQEERLAVDKQMWTDTEHDANKVLFCWM